ncbi:MAG: hypothetical protein R2795_05225 [Saprospiraceae bacterium]
MNIKLALFLLVIIFSIYIGHSQDIHSTIRIVVLDAVVNSSSLNDEDGTALGRSIRNSLTKYTTGTSVEILEREKIASLLEDRSNAEKLEALFDRESAIAYGELLQASHVVFSNVYTSTLFNGMRISARIVDVRTGIVLTAEEIQYKNTDDYENMVSQLAKQLLIISNIGIEAVNSENENNEIIVFESPFSNEVYRCLSNFKELIPNVYLRNEMTNEMLANCQANNKINIDAKIIGGIDLYNSSFEFHIVFNSEGIYFRRRISDSTNKEDKDLEIISSYVGYYLNYNSFAEPKLKRNERRKYYGLTPDYSSQPSIDWIYYGGSTFNKFSNRDLDLSRNDFASLFDLFCCISKRKSTEEYLYMKN